MKALIIGGRNQNKLEYAKSNFNFDNYFCGNKDDFSLLKEHHVLYGLNHLIMRMIKSGFSDNEIKNIIMKYNYDIVISDEIGCAIVSIDKDERRCVELTGRICCKLAEQSENVIRVICGIPQFIKGKQ